MRALALCVLLASAAAAQEAALPLGVGVAHPNALGAGAPLLFFGAPEAEAPLDSLTVREGPHHWEIATAPPWLDPETVLMEADLLAFRVVALRRGWAEVAVHARDIRWPPRTMWLRRDGLSFRPWAEVLLDVHGVHVSAPVPIHLTPEASGEAAAMAEAGRPMLVLEVRGAWARVAYADATEAEAGPLGWIRWRGPGDAGGERLLVGVSLLG